MVAEIEGGEGRLRNTAGAGGGDAPNPNTHNPSIRCRADGMSTEGIELVPHERWNVDVVVIVPTDTDRRTVRVHRHAGRFDRLEER